MTKKQDKVLAANQPATKPVKEKETEDSGNVISEQLKVIAEQY